MTPRVFNQTISMESGRTVYMRRLNKERVQFKIQWRFWLQITTVT